MAAKKEHDVMCAVKIGLVVRVKGRVTRESIADGVNNMIDEIELGPFVAADVLDGYAVEDIE